MEVKAYKLNEIAELEKKPYQTLLYQKKQNPKLYLKVIIWKGKQKPMVRYLDRVTTAKIIKNFK